jgi:hypothetical protein
MSLGATSDTAMTASQLDEKLDAMAHSIANAIIVGTDHHAPLGLVQRSNQPPHWSLVCILTKLFLLTDTSLDYQDTCASSQRVSSYPHALVGKLGDQRCNL